MKKIIKKFWGVGLVLILLSTLLVGAVPQASALPYFFANSLGTPNSIVTDTTLAPVATTGLSILDVDQSGATVIATTSDNTVATQAKIWRSLDGGETWAQVLPTIQGFNNASYLGYVAVAPDDANVFAVVRTDTNPDQVWLTNNGGVTFAQLTALPGNTWINDIDISPLFANVRNLTIAGNLAQLAAPLPVGDHPGLLLNWQVGALAPAWAAPTGFNATLAAAGIDNVNAVQYSTNFAADNIMMVVTTTVSNNALALPGNVALRIYSYNTNVWDAAVDVTFPRHLEVAANAAVANNVSACTRAHIDLDANFYLGDAAAQIGFIGASITVAGVEAGGVYRVGTYATAGGNYTLTQIMTGTAINSVAWDGTNLMAAQYDNVVWPTAALTVWRTTTALGTVVTWLPSSTFKTPGTGSFPLVIYNSTSGYGYCFSRGANAAVARTTDYGLSFNGIALVNSTFGNVLDFWVSPDASRIYTLTSDNYDLNLWRKDGTTWQRVFILAGAGSATVPAAQTWLVRAADSDVDAVYLGRKGATNMYKSLDGGDFVWSVRASSTAIADFAVQDASTVYVLSNATGAVVKSVTGAFTWLTAVSCMGLGNAGGFGFHIKLLADDQIIVGGTLGGVGYSADGATTFTYLGATTTGGNTLVAATGVATGDTIWALDCTGAGAVYRWLIGTSVTFVNSQSATATAGATGLAYADGVLYVMDSGTPSVNRYLYPTTAAIFGAGATDVIACGANYNQTFMVNSLQNAVTTSSVTLYTMATTNTVVILDTLDTFTDYLTGAEDAPVPTYPINNAIIPINSISGLVNAFTFQWEASPTISMTAPFNTAYNYNVVVYLDEAGTIPFAGSAGQIAAVLGANSVFTTAAEGSGFGTVAGNTAFAGVPGEAYYWRVRVDANAPAESYWSEMQVFNVQQLTAIVPVIASPENGTEVNTTMPAFSWSPIANATSYQFELATDADFTDIIYSATPASAGAQADIDLTRGAQYFWRVKALTPTEGEWSTVANFIVAELPATTEPITITTAPEPTYTITQPADTTVVTSVTVTQPPTEEVNPSYVWAIIIIGAVLVIAVIVLIVRTRRSV